MNSYVGVRTHYIPVVINLATFKHRAIDALFYISLYVLTYISCAQHPAALPDPGDCAAAAGAGDHASLQPSGGGALPGSWCARGAAERCARRSQMPPSRVQHPGYYGGMKRSTPAERRTINVIQHAFAPSFLSSQLRWRVLKPP